jgi:uncharacterized membrane protein
MKTTTGSGSDNGAIKKRSEWPLIILMLIPIVYLISIWGTVKDQVPLHFNMQGVADDYGSRWVFALLSAGISIPIYLLMRFIPKLDPKKKISKDSKPFYMMRIGIAALMSAIGCWIIYTTTNYGNVKFSMRLVPILVSGFMILMGNYLPTIKQNYFMGIRTPWTLELPEVWTKTHLITGRAFFYGGFICLLLSVFLPELALVFVTTGGMLAISVFGVIYSYVIYKKITGHLN